jgi:hypothetical protein
VGPPPGGAEGSHEPALGQSEELQPVQFKRSEEQCVEELGGSTRYRDAGVPTQAELAGYREQCAREAEEVAEEVDEAVARYWAFVSAAEGFGLPVRFLEEVGRSYAIVVEKGDSDRVRTVLNRLILSTETMDNVQNLSLDGGMKGSSGIGTIFHEATHAWLDLNSDRPEVAGLTARGEEHYEGAPLQGGGVTSDPWRVFQEAAASYVGERAGRWWSTFQMLSSLAAAQKLTPDKLGLVQAKYDQEMAETVFGYSAEGGFLGIGASHRYTSRPSPLALRRFLDQTLLEGKIPAQFSQVAAFSRFRSGP